MLIQEAQHINDKITSFFVLSPDNWQTLTPTLKIVATSKSKEKVPKN